MPDQTEEPVGGAQLDMEEKAPAGIGESAAEQAAPMSTVARKVLADMLIKQERAMGDCKALIELLDQRPELDSVLCRLLSLGNPR